MSKQYAEIHFTNKESLVVEDFKDMVINEDEVMFKHRSGNTSVICKTNVNYIHFYSVEDSDVI